MAELASQKRHRRINLTDPEARLMKGRQGIVAGYLNAQAMVSPMVWTDGGATSMLVPAVDVVDAANDNAPAGADDGAGRGDYGDEVADDIGRRRILRRQSPSGVRPSRSEAWWCQRHDNGSSKTHITRTDSPMTNTATASGVPRDRRSRSSAYSMRTESRCDCTGLQVLFCQACAGLQSLYQSQRDWAKPGHRAAR